MAAEGDYIMINKNNLIAKSGIATQNRTNNYEIVGKVYVTVIIGYNI